MTWITEGTWTAYFVVAAVAMVFIFTFFVTRRVIYLWGIALGALLALGVWLVDYLVVTDREQVELNLREMAKAAERGDINRLGEFISEDFNFLGLNRREILRLATKNLPATEGRKIAIGELQVTAQTGQRSLTGRCVTWVSGSFGYDPDLKEQPYQLEVTFIKESDGAWRMQKFKLFNPLGTEEVHIPR